jgi:hypothetical protein
VAGVDFLTAVPALLPNDPGLSGSPVVFLDGFVEAGGGSGQFIYISVNAQEAQGSRVSVLVARLHRDGRLDTTFGDRGFLRIPGFHSVAGVAGEQLDGSALLPLRAPDGVAIIRIQGGTTPGPGLISLADNGTPALEGERAFAYVSRSLGSLGAASVRFRTIPGTATAETDYTAVSGTLSWVTGEIGTRRIEIPIFHDQQADGGEGFLLVLEAAEGGVTVLNPALQVQIADRPPQIGPQASTPDVSTSTDGAGSGGGSIDPGALTFLLLGLLHRTWRMRRKS